MNAAVLVGTLSVHHLDYGYVRFANTSLHQYVVSSYVMAGFLSPLHLNIGMDNQEHPILLCKLINCQL